LPANRTSFQIAVTAGQDASFVLTDLYGNINQVHVFTADASFTMQNTQSGTGGYVNMCIVGGGGGGAGSPTLATANSCGGAGAGQLMFVDNYLMQNGSYHIQIGNGGQGGTSGASPTNGQDGSGTILSNSTTLFKAAGGAGGAVEGSLAENGIDGSYNIFPYPNNLLNGTSSGGGGNAVNISGGGARTVNYQDTIVSNLGLPCQVWSYGNGGGRGYNSGSGIVSGGGGGGAGGTGGDASLNTLANSGGNGGKGIFIYFIFCYMSIIPFFITIERIISLFYYWKK
jgi:hypothetical protein